jgi:hypothetical protein
MAAVVDLHCLRVDVRLVLIRVIRQSIKLEGASRRLRGCRARSQGSSGQDGGTPAQKRPAIDDKHIQSPPADVVVHVLSHGDDAERANPIIVAGRVLCNRCPS